LVGELEAAEAAVRALQQLELAGQHPQTLLDLTQRLFTLSDQLDAALQRAIEQIHWSSASWDAAHLGPIRWLIEQCRRAPGEATSRVKVAQRIIDHPASAAAHAAGTISLAHLKIITTTLKELPEADRDTAEAILLRAAQHLDPKELARLARELEAVVAPELEDQRAARRYRSRYLSVAATFAGMVHINGVLDPETGAALIAALEPLMKPHGEEDPRSADQRRADALGQLARDALASDRLPDLNGSQPHIQVTIDWQALLTGVGLGSIGAGGQDLPLDAGTIRRMACDAHILPVILGGPSGVLDIGRTSRTWTPTIRRAAALRDSGCTFPGCRAPIAFCELHHIQHWTRDHGPSSLFNSAHLCVRHHHLLHQPGWTLTRHPDGTLTFTDPQGHTSTWQPPTTLTDYLPNTTSAGDFGSQPPTSAGDFGSQPSTSAARPASTSAAGPSPAPGNPSGSGPDIACQIPGRHVIRARIRPRQRSTPRLSDEGISARVPFPTKNSRRYSIYTAEISDGVSLVAARCPLREAGRYSAATPGRRRQRFLCRFTRAPPHVPVIEQMGRSLQVSPRSVTITEQDRVLGH
jgi:hypothetical protein